MLERLKKWFQVGGPEYRSPSWNWQSIGWPPSPTGKGSPPSQQELATLSAVHRACTLFSDSAGSQLWSIVQESPTGGVVTVRGSDASSAIRDWDYVGREMWIFSACLVGNGYAQAHRNSRGGVSYIESIAPWRVSLEWTDSGNLVYRIAEDDNLQQAERVVPAEDMLHLKFRETGKHPLLGVSPLQQLAPALQPWFSVREGIGTVYQWVSLPGTAFQTDEKLTKEQMTQLRESIESRENGRPVILSHGLQMKEVPIPTLDNLQALEMMKFSVEECARAYGVPVSLLAQTESVNYSSAAEQSRQFVTVSLQPFARRIESCLSQALLTRSERMAGLSVAIDLLPMLLGHGQERSEYFSRMVNGGIMSVNEARNLSGLADVTDGDVLRAPENTSPLDQWAAEPEPARIAPVAEPVRGSGQVIRMLRHVS